jgi:NRPS condensation-like uncharacterized protein
MKRELGKMETALVITDDFAPLTVAAVLRLSGAPEPERLRAALDELQRRHPLLQARLVRQRRSVSFDGPTGVPEISMTVRSRTSTDQWQEMASAALNRRVDTASGPMLECTYLHDADTGKGDILFAYHHAIMDGTSASALFDELLAMCSVSNAAGDITTASTSAAATRTVPSGYPPSVDDLLPASVRGRERMRRLASYMKVQAADEISYQRSIRGRQPAVASADRCVVATRSLDVDETNRMISLARRKRLTTNSIVGAALLRATYEHLHDGETVPMRAIAFADLRNDLTPQPSADVLGCYIAMLRHTVTVGPDQDLWSLAQTLQDEIRASVTGHEHLLAAGMAKSLMKMILGVKRMRMADTAVSYAGPVALCERYGDITVDDVHGFVATNRLAPFSSALVQIVGGRLTWDFVFLEADLDEHQREKLADTVLNKLIEVNP